MNNREKLNAMSNEEFVEELINIMKERYKATFFSEFSLKKILVHWLEEEAEQ